MFVTLPAPTGWHGRHAPANATGHAIHGHATHAAGRPTRNAFHGHAAHHAATPGAVILVVWQAGDATFVEPFYSLQQHHVWRLHCRVTSQFLLLL